MPALLNGDYNTVYDDIVAVVNESQQRMHWSKSSSKPVAKRAEIVKACQIAESAGAAFVKTSTGFSSQGATPEAVRIMLETVDGRLGVRRAVEFEPGMNVSATWRWAVRELVLVIRWQSCPGAQTRSEKLPQGAFTKPEKPPQMSRGRYPSKISMT